MQSRLTGGDSFVYIGERAAGIISRRWLASSRNHEGYYDLRVSTGKDQCFASLQLDNIALILLRSASWGTFVSNSEDEKPVV